MKNVLLAAAALAVLSGSVWAEAPRHSPTTIVTLWDQNANFGAGVNSQYYGQAMVEYDDIAADDFVVPSGQTWYISEVDVTGSYTDSSSPASSFNIGFWKTKKGQPYRGITKDNFPTLSCADNAGSLQCVLPTRHRGKPVVKLPGGATYWLSVIANCDSAQGCGQWLWTENTTVQGYEAEWENPGGGWHINQCGGWMGLDACFGGSPADLAFTLKGYSQ